MKKNFKFSILVFCIIFSITAGGISVNAITEPIPVNNEQLQRELEKLKEVMVSKNELQEMVRKQENYLTKEEITQQLIETQKSRIAILEGNITALLTLLAVIVAILTLFGGIFVWISRSAFSSKVEEVEKHLSEMKQLKDETTTKIEVVRELSNNLNVAIRETQDLHASLNKSERAFNDETKRINQLGMYISFLELKVSRFGSLYKLEIGVRHSRKIISELEYWLEGTLPNYDYALIKVTEVLGSGLTKKGIDETIQDKLSYYKKSLMEEEISIRKEAAIPLEWLDYVDLKIDEYEDPLEDDFGEWEVSYNCIQKMHSIINAQITMNPNKFKPKI
ncbi:hypothetical protein [Sporosarcina sp. FSL K6-5500]|uniref:hypothetical protein n=1 Tax=Sporosarcina sp. FSL K6-5500 TaxID=2921558 RepID=UPI0030F5509A